MDTITHTAIGACLGEAIAGKQLGKKAMLFGAIANNLPDIDVIYNLWAEQTKALLLHRGITHSILVAVILSPSLAWAFQNIFKKYDMLFRKWLLLFGSGIFLHILVDAFTTYGTGWFEPFSNYRVSLNAIFILDPLLTLPVLIATIVLLVLKRESPKRKIWTRAGILMFSFYLLFVSVNKIRVNDIVQKNLALHKIQYVDYMATPTPLNNFLWYVLARTKNEFYIGYYSLFDNDANFLWERVEKNDSLLSAPCNPEHVKDLILFSQQYYRAELVNDTIIFSDMRFGQLGGWYKRNAPFVFNFKMAKNCTNRTALQKGRFESFSTETTIQLFKRIKGKN